MTARTALAGSAWLSFVPVAVFAQTEQAASSIGRRPTTVHEWLIANRAAFDREPASA